MKKIFSCFLSLLLISALLPVVYAAAPVDDALFLAEHGILSQSERSLPFDGVLTRGELVALINRTFGVFTTTGDKFIDADAESPYYYDLMAAKTEGYLMGYPDGSAKPDEPVSRVQAAVLFDRIMKLSGQAESASYTDASKIPAWAFPSVNRTVNERLMATIEGNFMPDAGFTRAEAYGVFRNIVESERNLKRIDEILEMTAYDGYTLTGRLSTPVSGSIDKLVVFVDGTGADTYEMRRHQGDLRFNYLDFFTDEFVSAGTAFFTYNTRGVYISGQPPFYTVDDEQYKTYTPDNVAKDLAVMVKELKADARLTDAKVLLWGWSEGAIIAPLAALTTDIEVDALLLAGYPNDNMRQILDWQLGGGQTFFLCSIYFETTDGDKITKAQYEADPYAMVDRLFEGMTFEELDFDSDGYITAADSKIMREPYFTGLLDAVETDGYEWIKNNFMLLTPEWFKGHFELGSTEDILIKLDLPIYIFHGTYDLNCPVSGVYAVEDRFEKEGKDNLTVNIYEEHDHDLNFSNWLVFGEIPDGIAGIFKTVEDFGN